METKSGAEERTRTSTGLPPHGPEPCASTNFATSATEQHKLNAGFAAVKPVIYSENRRVMAKTESGAKREFVAVQNRKARHDYEVMGRYETGIVLRGT